MLLKEIKEHFAVQHKDNDNTIFLFKDCEYMGSCVKTKRDWYKVENHNETNNINQFLDDVKSLNNGLRPMKYQCPLYFSGGNDNKILYSELRRTGWKENGHYKNCEYWVLQTQVFGSKFQIAVQIENEFHTDNFTVSYSLDTKFFSPIYYAECRGADNVLTIVQSIKKYVMQETIKQMVSLYETEFVIDQTNVTDIDEKVLYLDPYFRVWIANKTWKNITENDKTKFDKSQLEPAITLKKQQSFLFACDFISQTEQIAVQNESKYFTEI